jgi:hypothetical protein
MLKREMAYLISCDCCSMLSCQLVIIVINAWWKMLLILRFFSGPKGVKIECIEAFSFQYINSRCHHWIRHCQLPAKFESRWSTKVRLKLIAHDVSPRSHHSYRRFELLQAIFAFAIDPVGSEELKAALQPKKATCRSYTSTQLRLSSTL